MTKGPRRAQTPRGRTDAQNPTAAPAPRSMVALVERRGKFQVAEPFFGPGPRLALSRDSSYEVGDLVLVTPTPSGRRGTGARAKVARRLGKPDIARDVLEALMLDRGLARRFEPPVARAAREASEREVTVSGPASGPGHVASPRRDLRELATLTIDPRSARDFDDAISARELEGGGWMVWVHIADVSAYVTPRSPIDREAYRRGTSVYVPGAVEPMLPPSCRTEPAHWCPMKIALRLPSSYSSAAWRWSAPRSIAR